MVGEAGGCGGQSPLHRKVFEFLYFYILAIEFYVTEKVFKGLLPNQSVWQYTVPATPKEARGGGHYKRMRE